MQIVFLSQAFVVDSQNNHQRNGQQIKENDGQNDPRWPKKRNDMPIHNIVEFQVNV